MKFNYLEIEIYVKNAGCELQQLHYQDRTSVRGTNACGDAP